MLPRFSALGQTNYTDFPMVGDPSIPVFRALGQPAMPGLLISLPCYLKALKSLGVTTGLDCYVLYFVHYTFKWSELSC